jgi:hypothetical protein
MATDLFRLVRQQRAALAKTDAANLERIADAYALMYDRLSGDIEALTLAIEAMESPSAAMVRKLLQYKELMRKSERELTRFTSYLETVIDRASFDAIRSGLSDSAALVKAAGIVGQLHGIAPNAMREALNFLSESGPLYARLKLLTGSTVDKVSQTIFEGIAAGYNPRKIAAMIQDSFGGGLTDALRNVRTVQIKSYQESTRANYIGTNGIVTGWIWYANLAGDPCMSCIAMHGTEHTLDETLDDHYNGECAALPLIPDFGNPVEQNGQAWFDAQPEDRQKELMGASKYDAYKAGKFSFDALSNKQDNDVYGTMRTETSLKNLIGE